MSDLKITDEERRKILKEFFDKPKKILLRLYILTKLLDGAEHGYSIRKTILENTFKTWKPSNYLIYNELKSLERSQLINSIIQKRGELKLKKYVLTSQGRQELFKLGITIISIFDTASLGLDLKFPSTREQVNKWLSDIDKLPADRKTELLVKMQRAVEIFLEAIKTRLQKRSETG